MLLLISVELILKKLSLLDALKGEPFGGAPWLEVLVDILAQVIVLARYGPKDIGFLGNCELAGGGASLGYLADSLLYGVGGSHGQSHCQQYDDD